MESILHAIFYDRSELYIPDDACAKALNQLDVYFEQVDSAMGAEFGQQLRDAEFEVSKTECFSFFNRGFRLAVQLLIGKQL